MKKNILLLLFFYLFVSCQNPPEKTNDMEATTTIRDVLKNRFPFKKILEMDELYFDDKYEVDSLGLAALGKTWPELHFFHTKLLTPLMQFRELDVIIAQKKNAHDEIAILVSPLYHNNSAEFSGFLSGIKVPEEKRSETNTLIANLYLQLYLDSMTEKQSNNEILLLRNKRPIRKLSFMYDKDTLEEFQCLPYKQN